MLDPRKVAGVLGGKPVLGREIRTVGDLESAVRKGLPKRALLSAAMRAAGRAEGARSVVHRYVPRATFNRVKMLGALHSERTERLARLVALAEEIWGDPDDARAWLNAPHPELDERTPIDSAVSDLGARRAELVLMKGAYGLPV